MDTSTKIAVAVLAGIGAAVIVAGVAEHYAMAKVQGNALQAATAALAAVNPCLQSSEPQVREFQRQAIAGGYYSGPEDGRYGRETQLALQGLIGTSAPAACSPRPSWWGPDSTTTNP